MRLQAIDKEGKEFETDTEKWNESRTVLYFYPKDSTSGCTKEACDFRDNMGRLTAMAEVVGVSPDSIVSHKKFQQKQGLNFTLVADTEHLLAEHFGVWKEKSMYGRTYMGIERSTFILDGRGRVLREWRKVKVAGHVEEVMRALKELA